MMIDLVRHEQRNRLKNCSGRKWHRRQNRYMFGNFLKKMTGYIVH